MLSMQTIFDKVWYGIHVQGRPSVEGGDCQYRSATGSCGVGQLIPDQEYHLDFDRGKVKTVGGLCGAFGTTPSSSRFREAMLRSGVDVRDGRVRDLLQKLQWAHDQNSELPPSLFLEGFRAAMRQVASEFNLQVPS